MGGQLDGNFLPGSLPHKFILFVTLIICFAVNIFFSLSTLVPSPVFTNLAKPEELRQEISINAARPALSSKCEQRLVASGRRKLVRCEYYSLFFTGMMP